MADGAGYIRVGPIAPQVNGVLTYWTGLSAAEVQWVVNHDACLGVKIGEQFFWLFEGESYVYRSTRHADGAPRMWRPIDAQEFGRKCRPPHLGLLFERYRRGDGWQRFDGEPYVEE